MTRLIVLSGPSGVGKGPIVDWMKKTYYPGAYDGRDLHSFCQVKVHKTAGPRHTGKESELGLEGVSRNRYDFDCRGSPQAIDLDELDKALGSHDAVLLEAYYKAFDFLKERYGSSVDFASTFVSPLPLLENRSVIPDMMLDCLVRRAMREGKNVTQKLIEDLLVRAKGSEDEMNISHKYRNFIVNECYESDPRWHFSTLSGEPRKAVDTLYKIVCGGGKMKVRPDAEIILKEADNNV